MIIETLNKNTKDLKRPQLTLKESTNENVKSVKSKNKKSLKGGSTHKKIELNDEHLDEILHNKNL